MYEGNDHPSDIDMFYIGKDKYLVLCEIKNEKGELKQGQRRMLEDLVRNWKHDGMVIYVTHNKYYQYGDRIVDVSECYVQEIFYKALGRWTKPKRPTKVREIIEFYRGHSNFEQIDNFK